MAPTGTAPALASVNGIELAYRTFGTGEPLVLLHGGFGTVEMFGPNVEALARGPPGHRGRSPVARAVADRRTGRCASRRWPTTSRR